MATKEGKVRLTKEAHNLLAKKAEDSGSSMKEIASATIIDSSRRQREIQRYQFGTFLFGALTGGCLVCAYFVGMI